MSVQTDPRIDEYIRRAAPFARPILKHLRRLVHAECPEAQETLKWSSPAFLHNGQILFIMMAFKAHLGGRFWHPEVSRKAEATLGTGGDSAGQFGRITRPEDLPADDVIRGYLAEAVRRAATGQPARPKSAGAKPRPEAAVPGDFLTLLERHPLAHETFERFSPGQRREYVEWITEAKREETRVKRLTTAIEWLAQGKTRHWKYANC